MLTTEEKKQLVDRAEAVIEAALLRVIDAMIGVTAVPREVKHDK